MKNHKRLAVAFLICVAATNASSEVRFLVAKRQEAFTARKFVQSFYDWYVVEVEKTHRGPWDVILKPRRTSFSPILLNALHEDALAAAKAKGELVGLDFDPFLNSQDPDKHYFAGKVEMKGSFLLVSVSSGKPSAKPIVTAKIENHNGQWRFTNFLYPDSGNLLGVLKQLKTDR